MKTFLLPSENQQVIGIPLVCDLLHCFASCLFVIGGTKRVRISSCRAIYFFTYANTKAFLNERITPETPFVHILSAMNAGTATLLSIFAVSSPEGQCKAPSSELLTNVSRTLPRPGWRDPIWRFRVRTFRLHSSSNPTCCKKWRRNKHDTCEKKPRWKLQK